MTPKQAAFIQAYIDTQNASEAYRLAYNSNAAANIIHRKAYDLLQHPAIKKELDTLKAESREQNKITIDSILQELEQARTLALDNIQCSAAVTATMSKAKLLGLVVDKSETNTKVLTPPVFNIVGVTPKDLSDTELKAELAKYGIDT